MIHDEYGIEIKTNEDKMRLAKIQSSNKKFGKLEEYYDIPEEYNSRLGLGCSGEVVRCFHKET